MPLLTPLPAAAPSRPTSRPAAQGHLSAPGATALYIGALMGPSLMLIPGLAVDTAGPASLVAWLLLMVLSGAFALIFAQLGMHVRHGGIAAYARVGFGPLAGRIVTWCFICSTLVGMPYVCLIGGAYFSQLLGWGRPGVALAASAIVAIVLALAASGARIGVRVQMALVAFLVATVLVGVAGALPQARTAHWAPFAPQGWMAVGSAASLIIMSFIGWEAIAPLIERLERPRRQLPGIIATAFAVTSVVYLAVVITTVSVLGAHPGGASLARLLGRALGGIGPVLAAVVATLLVVASSHAYVSGTVAAALAAAPGHERRARRWLYAAVVGVNALVFLAYASGAIDLEFTIRFPAALSLTIYVLCTAAAARVFHGALRAIAAFGTVMALGVLAFTGYALIAPALVIAAVCWFSRKRRPRDGRSA